MIKEIEEIKAFFKSKLIVTAEEDKELEKTYYKYKREININMFEPMDLLFIDIDPNYYGGITVTRIPETLEELNQIKQKVESGKWELKAYLKKYEIEKYKHVICEEKNI